MIHVDERLFIRPLAPDDLEALHGLAQSSRGMRWLDWWSDQEGNRALIEASLHSQRETGGMWAGVWSCGELAGVMGLTAVNQWNRTARLDYWLGEAFQGQGLVTRSGRAMLRYAFSELGLNRVQITCATANHQSQAVAGRLGFTREGTLRRVERFNPRVHREADFAPEDLDEPAADGARFFDHAVYSLLRREWLEQLGVEHKE